MSPLLRGRPRLVILVRRPRLADLYCGGGGAAMGYYLAGFEVVGVDIEPQPDYPFEFHQADALTFSLEGFDAAHASAPCHDHIRGGLQKPDGTGWLLAATREKFAQVSVPWVIENVPGAPMRADYILCGSQFGLSVRRHRWFETSWRGFSLLPPCNHSGRVVGVYGHLHGLRGAWPGMLPGTLQNWRAGLGIDWLDADSLRLAIPPAYTRYIGSQLLEECSVISAQL